MLSGYRGETLEPLAPGVPGEQHVACPECGHDFAVPAPPVSRRVTETVEAAPAKPYGDVEYADPGYQGDGKKRYPLDTEKHVRSAWSYINQDKNAKAYTAEQLKKIKAKVKAAMRKLGMTVSENSTTEARINGKLSFDDLRELVRAALYADIRLLASDPYDCWCWIVDISDTDVVYQYNKTLFQRPYTIDGKTVTLGDAAEVERTYAPVGSGADDNVEAVATTTERVELDASARVLEARGKDDKGHRIFRVRIIAPGDSKNGRRYPESVLKAAVPLYEGSKSYDQHRSEAEMNSGTVRGLAGYFTDVSYNAGVEADFHVFPSRVDIAEALDATLALAAKNPDAEPLVGFSHDVYGTFRSITENGRHINEAVSIDAVNSADVVGHPAAGGKPERVVATNPGGTAATTEQVKEGDVPASAEEVLAALAGASDELLARHGFSRATETKTDDPAPVVTSPAPAPVTETNPVGALAKESWMVGAMVREKVGKTRLGEAMVGQVLEALPAQVTEATIDSHISTLLTAVAQLEKAELVPQVAGRAQVTQDERDRKAEAMEAFFDGDFRKGYRSFKHMWADWTGYRESFLGDEDVNIRILRECAGVGYDSALKRKTESVNTATFDLALGDAMYRRMMKMWAQPNLQGWRKVVSDIVPVPDFRQQKRERIGGYGLLPVVGQAAPYQPLTSPTDEEAVYAVIKRGGTEDLTMEAIVNDDIGAIRQIPRLLGLAAAITLYRFVMDFLRTNPATTYDSTALFHTNHANTDNPAVLSQATLDAARAKMRQQTAYGNSVNILSILPKTLIVPPQLESMAYMLANSAVAVPSTPAGPSNTPNLHQGLDVEVVDYFASDANDWFLGADTNGAPTIEIGFYQGREDPELFTQSDPNVGSMFNNDTVTYKIRHVYNGAILDHRGFYRGAN